MQFDEAERGFSFRFDGPLDMRMEGRGRAPPTSSTRRKRRRSPTSSIIYGEERAARRIARAIVHDREAGAVHSRRAARRDDRARRAGDARRHPSGDAEASRRCASRSTTNWANCSPALARGRARAAPRRPARGRDLPFARGSHRQAVSSPSAAGAARPARAGCRASPRRRRRPSSAKGASRSRRRAAEIAANPRARSAKLRLRRARAAPRARPLDDKLAAAGAPAGARQGKRLNAALSQHSSRSCALIGSAVYAYSIKYQTSYRAEQIAKTKLEIKAERDAIAVLRAEWAYMTRPERLQPLADKYLPDLEPLQLTQIVTSQSLPQKTRTRCDRRQAQRDRPVGRRRRRPPRQPRRTDDAQGATAKAKSATPKVAATAKAPTASQQGPSQRAEKAMTDRCPDAGAATSRRRLRANKPSRWSACIRARLFDETSQRARRACGSRAVGFLALYGVICGKLVYLGFKPEPATMRRAAAEAVAAARPDIVDRNGEVLASDVKVMSVFAEPRRLIDKDEATELLTAVLPDVDSKELRERLGSKKGFVWVKREVTPHQRDEVFHLGLPGVGLIAENKRVYPNGPIGAHVLGFANVDNQGIAGIEKYIDGQGLADLHSLGFGATPDDLQPITLSLDIRATHALRDELVKGVEHFKAKAGAAAIMDVNTGEVIALASLPDYDPNKPTEALDPTAHQPHERRRL